MELPDRVVRRRPRAGFLCRNAWIIAAFNPRQCTSLPRTQICSALPSISLRGRRPRRRRLALRIAGYHEFARSNGPVPFIADDIMESFDNDRTAEAIGLLSQMSETGQVIYLTHHLHVCEIAKEICPDVHVYELAP